MRLEAPVLVEGDGGVVGGEDVEVDGAHVAVVVDAGAQVREQVAQHEGGDAVAAVLLQHTQRQDVRDLGAVTACNGNKSFFIRIQSRKSAAFGELGEKSTEYGLYGTLKNFDILPIITNRYTTVLLFPRLFIQSISTLHICT